MWGEVGVRSVDGLGATTAGLVSVSFDEREKLIYIFIYIYYCFRGDFPCTERGFERGDVPLLPPRLTGFVCGGAPPYGGDRFIQDEAVSLVRTQDEEEEPPRRTAAKAAARRSVSSRGGMTRAPGGHDPSTCCSLRTTAS